MPNQIKPEYETIIYNYIRDYPTHGPRRISNELKAQGVTISETGVYNVLKRKGLNHRIDRLFYAQEHSDNPVITESYLREKEKKNVYTSLEQLQDDLDSFIYYYNFKRTNQGYRLKGKIPYQKLLDGKRKLTLP